MQSMSVSSVAQSRHQLYPIMRLRIIFKSGHLISWVACANVNVACALAVCG